MAMYTEIGDLIDDLLNANRRDVVRVKFPLTGNIFSRIEPVVYEIVKVGERRGLEISARQTSGVFNRTYLIQAKGAVIELMRFFNDIRWIWS